MINIWTLAEDKLSSSLGGRTSDDVKLALNRDSSIVFAGDNKNVDAFDTGTGTVLWSIAAHDRNIADLALHPSQPLLASCGDDGTVVLIDVETGRLLKRLRVGPPRGRILQVDFSPRGDLLAAAMSNGAVVVLRTPWE
jgi:WD40 repeat protein